MSAFYDNFLEMLTKADIDLENDTIRARIGRTSAYGFDASHVNVSSCPSAIVTDQTLGSKALVDGTLDAANSVFPSVPSGADIDMILIFKFVTNDAGSLLIAYLDGFAKTPNDGDMTVTWQETSPFIFKV